MGRLGAAAPARLLHGPQPSRQPCFARGSAAVRNFLLGNTLPSGVAPFGPRGFPGRDECVAPSAAPAEIPLAEHLPDPDARAHNQRRSDRSIGGHAACYEHGSQTVKKPGWRVTDAYGRGYEGCSRTLAARGPFADGSSSNTTI